MLKFKSFKKLEGRIYYHLNKLFEPDFTNEFFIPNKKQFYQYTLKSMGIILVLSLIGTSFACLESEHPLVKENINGKLFNTIIFTVLSYAMVLKSMHNVYKQVNNPNLGKIIVSKILWIMLSFTFTMMTIKSLNLNEIFMSLQTTLNNSGFAVLENNVKLAYGLSILSFLFVVFEGGFSLLQKAARSHLGRKLFKNMVAKPNSTILVKQPLETEMIYEYNYKEDFKIIKTKTKESTC